MHIVGVGMPLLLRSLPAVCVCEWGSRKNDVQRTENQSTCYGSSPFRLVYVAASCVAFQFNAWLWVACAMRAYCPALDGKHTPLYAVICWGQERSVWYGERERESVHMLIYSWFHAESKWLYWISVEMNARGVFFMFTSTVGGLRFVASLLGRFLFSCLIREQILQLDFFVFQLIKLISYHYSYAE